MRSPMFNTQFTARWYRFKNLLAQFCRKIPVNTKEYFLFIVICLNPYLPMFLFNPKHSTENFVSYFHQTLKLIVTGGQFPAGTVTGSWSFQLISNYRSKNK